ncbi:putative nucleic acid-binding protein, contains PIN domain [Burkholderia sp. Ch1-1]|nr:putative nucleic acid-binding protein, contains PIN domain [Burkholderia sp. Ch1-1]
MKYVLDTNVLNQLVKAKAQRNAEVDSWLSGINDNELYFTVLSAMEIQAGIEKLRRNKDPEKHTLAQKIQDAFEAILEEHADRILPVDVSAARDWGRRTQKHGTKNANDLGIIAIVSTQTDAVAVTRNEQDFRHRGISVLNPFKKPPEEFHDLET